MIHPIQTYHQFPRIMSMTHSYRAPYHWFQEFPFYFGSYPGKPPMLQYPSCAESSIPCCALLFGLLYRHMLLASFITTEDTPSDG
jgi:hypothetical protein